ncbi:MAG: aldolase catalytic domain-containing protein [Eubacteriales bacterium]|nr:aldolase catalytic domain-containing protein [Eubacteriales bacterium]
MGDIKLLDCTLRDGGYVNDWEFGRDNLISVFERLVSAGVDVIEVGFIDDRRPFDINRSILPDTKSFEKIYGGLDHKDTMVVGMIDYGTCKLENIQPCEDSILDGIRVIFKKHKRKEAIAYCSELKKLGYKVFVQLVSITSYSDEELRDLIGLANELEPYAVSMVDTYGLLQKENLLHYFTVLNEELKESIALGYHSHNNFQRAFANCEEMLSNPVERDLLVDATIYGMGKSAGNCPIELLAMHLNDRFNKNYHISQILEALDANIMNIYRVKPWGYTMFFYIAALNNCHPSYVSYLMDKRTLSVKQINEILAKLKDYGDKQLLYDQELIEHLYRDYQKKISINDESDVEKLKSEFAGRNVLLLGPGKTIERDKKDIIKFIQDKNPIVVSVNFISDDIPTDYIFLSNAKRYVMLATALTKKSSTLKIISTSNVTATDGESFDYTLDISSLLDENAEIVDNSFVMLLKVMIKIGVKEVALGGFDGYSGKKNKDYIDARMEYTFTKEQATGLNQYVSEVIESLGNSIIMKFITESLYVK